MEALGLVFVSLSFTQSAMRVRKPRESDTAIYNHLQSHILEKSVNWAAEIADPVEKPLTKETVL